MSFEAAHRPGGARALTTEQVLVALAHAGYSVSSRQQALGDAMGAAYCSTAVGALANAVGRIEFSWCEFATDTDAQRANAKLVAQTAKALPGIHRAVRKNVTMSAQAVGVPTAVADQALQTFSSL